MSYLPIVLFIVTVVVLGAMSAIVPTHLFLKRTTDGAYRHGSSDAPPMAYLRRGFNLRATMQVFVSIVVSGCAMYIVLSHAYDPQEKHWAYGSLGTILGFWLRGSK